MNAEPLKSRLKDELVRVAQLMIKKTGIKPQTLYSDQDPALSSGLFEDFAAAQSITVVFIKSLHKVSLAENTVKCIKQSLARYTSQDKGYSIWPTYLPNIMIWGMKCVQISDLGAKNTAICTQF